MLRQRQTRMDVKNRLSFGHGTIAYGLQRYSQRTAKSFEVRNTFPLPIPLSLPPPGNPLIKIFIYRYVGWVVYVLHQHRKTGRIDSVPLPGSPFSHYYAQENADEGIMIETNVTIKEVIIYI